MTTHLTLPMRLNQHRTLLEQMRSGLNSEFILEDVRMLRHKGTVQIIQVRTELYNSAYFEACFFKIQTITPLTWIALSTLNWNFLQSFFFILEYVHSNDEMLFCKEST
jgi:hypothetical protein